MNKLFLTAILSGFVFVEFGCADDTNSDFNGICDLEFVKEEIKITNENKHVISNEMNIFEGAKCRNGVMIFDYTYTPKYSAELENFNDEQKKVAKRTMQHMLNSMYCEMPEFASHRENSVVMHYNYSTTNVKNFYEVEVSNKDCKK
ncbi:MAG: hypothetical protein IJT33_06015 [Campylobacter sp.]|nr:hypothetical protein [Campylobacter sp.]MBQ7675996.1 hypothetical protein [Campylobacter sp.]